MPNNVVDTIEDYNGVDYRLVAVIPGVNITVTMLTPGSQPTSSASVASDGTVTIALGIPSTMGIKDVSISQDGIITITMDDDSTETFDGMKTAIQAANSAATSANTAANEATAAKTAAETATSEAQAATTAATNAATAANNAAQTALASVGNMLIGEYADTTGGQMFTTEDAYATGTLHGLTVYGKSTQETTTGANLWSIGDLSGTGGTGSIVLPYPLQPGTYTIVCDVVSSDTDYNVCLFRFFNDSDVEVFNRQIQRGVGVSFTFTLSETATKFNFYASTGYATSSGDTFSLTNVMLNSGSTALPYEPYTGGIPSPNPDYPQEIKSVVEGNVWLSGKNLLNYVTWIEYLRDILAPSRFGSDTDGDYFTATANAVSSSTIYLKGIPFKENTQYTFIYKCKKSNDSGTSNMAVEYTDGSTKILTFAEVANVVVYGLFVSEPGKTISHFRGTLNSGLTYFYYEQCGLFEGALTMDDYTPYVGTSLDFLPAGIEPLRSLPDGTRDVLRIDKDGNGVIERNVKSVIINGNTVFNFEDSNRLAYFSAHWMKRVMDYRQTMISNTLPINNNQTRAEQKDYMAFTGYYSTVNPGRNYLYVSDVPSELQTTSALSNYFSQHVSEVLCALATPTTETIPASVMPQIPSEYLNAWLDASDQNGDAIDPAWGMEYERDLTITVNNIESAIADIVSA